MEFQSCAAIENGVKGIIPVDSVDEARGYLKKGYLAAAEREGQIVEGFPMGNSPISFLNQIFILIEYIITYGLNMK